MKSPLPGIAVILALVLCTCSMGKAVQKGVRKPVLNINAKKLEQTSGKVVWKWNLTSNYSWSNPGVLVSRVTLGKPEALEAGEKWTAVITLTVEDVDFPGLSRVNVELKTSSGTSVSSGGTRDNPQKLNASKFVRILVAGKQTGRIPGKTVLANLGRETLQIETSK